MSFRKEKKFKMSISEFHKFKNLLMQRGMIQLYESRSIHSIYFDTINLEMFFASEEGTLPRKKVRARWYNNNKKFTFENKVSSFEGRFKTTKKLTNISNYLDLFRMHYYDDQYGNITPSLQISYVRSYFSFRSMRITFDDQITYKSPKSGCKRIYKDPERVMEIKVPFDCPDDYIENHIPYLTSRFSKYSRGLLLSSGDLCEF